jgi:hypothetical protein
MVKIFGSFLTSQSNGEECGVVVSISHIVVQNHGGIKIRAGSTFRMILLALESNEFVESHGWRASCFSQILGLIKLDRLHGRLHGGYSHG